MNPHDEEYKRFKEPKYCFIPSCKNKSDNLEKQFFTVPNSCKQAWCNAVGANCTQRPQFICDVHLNLETDLENYVFWKTVKGVRPKLKTRLPLSLTSDELTLLSQTEIQQVPGPSSSTTNLIQSSNTKNKGVQVQPHTADRTTYCSLKKPKTVDEIKFSVEMDVDDEYPSTQGSTTSVNESDMSAETDSSRITSDTEGRTFMMNLVKEKPEVYIGLPKCFYGVIASLQNDLNIPFLYIVITLYKIKNNLPFIQICDMFQISRTTVWRFFYKSVWVLSEFLKQFIYTPDAMQVKKNLPSSFKTNKEYSNVFCIIDCFEIEIEKPSNPTHQALTWSQYKNANTLKYLLATTPDGLITFVSQGYGGRISDVKIVEKCGFLDTLPPKCTIMADRGFKNIAATLSKKDIKLLRPPSVAKDQKLSKEEAIKSKVIASLRIHVERVIRRIRMFKILKPHPVINNKLVSYTDNMVYIACGLINMQEPIVKSNS